MVNRQFLIIEQNNIGPQGAQLWLHTFLMNRRYEMALVMVLVTDGGIGLVCMKGNI